MFVLFVAPPCKYMSCKAHWLDSGWERCQAADPDTGSAGWWGVCQTCCCQRSKEFQREPSQVPSPCRVGVRGPEDPASGAGPWVAGILAMEPMEPICWRREVCLAESLWRSEQKVVVPTGVRCLAWLASLIILLYDARNYFDSEFNYKKLFNIWFHGSISRANNYARLTNLIIHACWANNNYLFVCPCISNISWISHACLSLCLGHWICYQHVFGINVRFDGPMCARAVPWWV